MRVFGINIKFSGMKWIESIDLIHQYLLVSMHPIAHTDDMEKQKTYSL